MRGRSVYVFALLILLMNLFGCSENKGNSIPAIDDEQKTTITENTGVILDTVVDVFKEPRTQSERVTQAIFNQPAEIVEEKDNWVKIKALDGFTGWIKSKYIDRDISSIKENGGKYRVVVTTKKSKVLSEAKYGAVLKEVVMGTELYPTGSSDGWYKVDLPGNKTGWINETGTINIPAGKHISKTTVDDFVATAVKFKGTVYLCGGVSTWGGIDGSGLTYISSRINGIDLPRGLEQQYKSGKVINKNLLIQGDLVFFSSNEGLKDISDVGIYTGSDQFLYVSKSKGSVTTGSMSDSYFQKRLIGVRRIF